MTALPSTPPTRWQRTTTRRFLKWLFSWQAARHGLIALAVFITLVALFYTEENIRGKRAWEQYRHEAEARGEQLDWKIFIPKPIPDEQNFAAVPLIKSWTLLQTNHTGQALKQLQKGDSYQQGESHVAVPGPGRGLPHRQFVDLSAWSQAFNAVRAGKITGWQKFAPGKLDLNSRAKAAPSILEELKTNDAMFAELRLAAQRPLSRYPIDYTTDDPAEILLPHLNKIKAACQRLRLKACTELASGQSEAALDDVKLILRSADSLNEEPFLISYLVRVACAQLAIQPIWEGLAEHAWSDAQLQELQALLQSHNLVADLKFPLDGERAMGGVIIDFVKKRGVGVLLGEFGRRSTKPSENLANAFGKILPSGWFYQEQVSYWRLYGLQITGTFDGASKRVYPDRIQSYDQDLDRILNGQNRFLMVFLHHRFMSALLLPALSRIPIKAAQAQTAIDQALLGCALERYRLAKGSFPDTLTALMPQFISLLPHDVITGEFYKYHLTKDGQFVLYSVGWNEKDDGGVTGETLFDEKEGDWVWRYPSP